jgi:FlaA1/EpsC-like NDP-sugar epimerase
VVALPGPRSASVTWYKIRASRRLQVEANESKSRRGTSAIVPTMLVGAGQAGVMVAKEIANRPDLGIRPVGFIDDDPTKHGIVVLTMRTH